MLMEESTSDKDNHIFKIISDDNLSLSVLKIN